MDGSANFGLPSTISPIFVDGSANFGLPSTISPIFVDDSANFGLPSTKNGFFVDGYLEPSVWLTQTGYPKLSGYLELSA